MNNDAISRQAAIKAIRNEIIAYKLSLESPSLNHEEKEILRNRKAQAIEDVVAIETLPSIEQMGQWILVTDGLPEIGDRTLVTVPSIDETFVTIGTYAGEHRWYIGDYGFCEKVTAWSPLPTPYKGGEKEWMTLSIDRRQ